MAGNESPQESPGWRPSFGFSMLLAALAVGGGVTAAWAAGYYDEMNSAAKWLSGWEDSTRSYEWEKILKTGPYTVKTYDSDGEHLTYLAIAGLTAVIGGAILARRRLLKLKPVKVN